MDLNVNFDKDFNKVRIKKVIEKGFEDAVKKSGSAEDIAWIIFMAGVEASYMIDTFTKGDFNQQKIDAIKEVFVGGAEAYLETNEEEE